MRKRNVSNYQISISPSLKKFKKAKESFVGNHRVDTALPKKEKTFIKKIIQLMKIVHGFHLKTHTEGIGLPFCHKYAKRTVIKCNTRCLTILHSLLGKGL